MKLRHSRKEAPDVNLTPLIDVVFLLLIFFMVSTTFDRNAELAIELPEAGAEAADAEPDTIEIAIDARGQFYVNGRVLVNTQLETVERALHDSAAGRDGPPVVITADAETPHQAVMTVMDAARRVGLTRLTFAAHLVNEEP